MAGASVEAVSDTELRVLHVALNHQDTGFASPMNLAFALTTKDRVEKYAAKHELPAPATALLWFTVQTLLPLRGASVAMRNAATFFSSDTPDFVITI